MTREHVIPSFLYKLQKSSGKQFVGWNEVVQKMVGGEAKVKDVCSNCNNGVLSELDAYGKQVLDEAGILVHNYLGRSLVLKYDYARLLRWSLKVSFNSSRTDGAHRHLFEDFVPFILGVAESPPRKRVALLAYLASPIALDKTQEVNSAFVEAALGAKTLNPLIVRICYGYVRGDDSLVLRINILGPLVLFMPIFNPEVLLGHAAASIRRLQKLHPGAVDLYGKKRLVQLRAGASTWIDMWSDQARRVRGLQGNA
ncbi:hypothetical protein [Ottowia thiooxydans]